MLRAQFLVAIIAMCLPHMAVAQRNIFPSRQALDSMVNPALSKVAHGVVEVDERLKNVGTIGAEDVARVKFVLHNTSSNTLTITDISTSCRCLNITNAPTSIAPHTKADVVAEYRAEGHNGEFRQNIWVYTSLDTQHPTERLSVVGVVHNDDEWLHLPKHMGILRMSRKEVVITSNGEERIVVANTSAQPIRLSGVSTIDGLTMRTKPEVIEAGAEADIMIGYRGTETDITTMIVVEGIAGRATDRVIKVTIKR